MAGVKCSLLARASPCTSLQVIVMVLCMLGACACKIRCHVTLAMHPCTAYHVLHPARPRFELPEGLSLPNLVGLAADAGVSAPLSGSSLARAFENNVDASLTWAFVGWLRSVTRLPLFVKARPSMVINL